ncbi:MAG: phosphoribosylglycinamide formyltransferase [Candidatus Diapherotrites archaeon]
MGAWGSYKEKKLKLGVLGSTRGTDLQAIIDAINNGQLNCEICLVVSDKKDAYILERAKLNNINTIFVDYSSFPERKDAEEVIVSELKKKNVDLILLIGFMKILSPFFVQSFKGRIWNVHPSLLPKYAGAMNLNVYEMVLKNRDKETGCTLHEVNEIVDGGKIILQKKVIVEKNDNVETLKKKVQKAEQECLLEALKMVIDGKIVLGA